MELQKYIISIKHRLGFHNDKCKRRIFTTENDYLCLITGKIFTNDIFKLFKKK